jgi:adenosylhomocysteine nucleosidase
VSVATPPILVLAALREELRAVEPALRERSTLRLGPISCERATLRGVAVAVARTGVGGERAAAAVSVLIEALRPSAVLATGFAGGLNPALRAGDVLVASRLLELGSGSREVWPAPEPLVRAAAGIAIAGGTVRTGALLTVDQVVSEASAKRELGARSGADAVDMESCAVACEAGRRGIPLLCARAILDDADYDLPFDFARIFTAGGKVHPLGALAAVLRRPAGLLALGELRRRAAAGAASLGEFLPPCVTALAEAE